MRIPLIAGNWKMHGSQSEVKTLIAKLTAATAAYHAIEMLVLPPYIYLSEVKALLGNPSAIFLGAQNLYVNKQGAFTGEISGAMLKDIGCQYVLVGHSERRTLFHEDLALVANKFKAAIDADLIPILCVGETKEQREQQKTNEVIAAQLESVIDLVGIESFKQAVIAYEPVWAIGTGLTATPELAETVHRFIRELIAQKNVDIAGTIRILYGGSMKPDNAAALLAMPNIDGGLIGGASLDANSFAQICAAGAKSVQAKPDVSVSNG